MAKADIRSDTLDVRFWPLPDMMSFGIRRKAKRRRVSYSFVFMRASGEQLSKITSLIDDGIIRPVMDRVLPFAETKAAMAYVETGRAKGKVVVKVR